MEPQTQTPDNPEQTELEARIVKLQNELSEVLNAEEFFNLGSGKLLVQLFAAEITRLTRDVTSEKYRKDPTGYNNALSDLLAYKNILKRIQLAGSPVRKGKILDALGTEEENAGQ